MYKMVSVGCPSLSWATVPLKRMGGQLTHHSGLTPPYDGGTCTRIEECRQNDTHHQ